MPLLALHRSSKLNEMQAFIYLPRLWLLEQGFTIKLHHQNGFGLV
jgi:hypothetical protein